MIITLTCRQCGRTFEEEVTEEQIEKYESGRYNIQDCFPNMRREIREILISGICPICWDEMFCFDEDEEEE